MASGSHHFKPLRGCSRCGAPGLKAPPSRKAPGWFYRSRTLAELANLPSVDPARRFKENSRSVGEHDRSELVLDWLKRCQKLADPENHLLVERKVTGVTPGNRTDRPGVRVCDQHDHRNNRIEKWLRDSRNITNGSQHSPLDNRFSRYMYDPKNTLQMYVKRSGGPIARPHTPTNDLFTKQKLRFGEELLHKNAAKESTFVDFDRMRVRTNKLHTDLMSALKE